MITKTNNTNTNTDIEILGGLVASHIWMNGDEGIVLPPMAVKCDTDSGESTVLPISPAIKLYSEETVISPILPLHNQPAVQMSVGKETFLFFTYNEELDINELKGLDAHILLVDLSEVTEYVGDATIIETGNLLDDCLTTGNPQILTWVYSPWLEQIDLEDEYMNKTFFDTIQAFAFDQCLISEGKIELGADLHFVNTAHA